MVPSRGGGDELLGNLALRENSHKDIDDDDDVAAATCPSTVTVSGEACTSFDASLILKYLT